MQSVVTLSNGLVSNPSVGEESRVIGRYYAECIGADGEVKWTEDFNNLVVNVGKNAMLDTYLAGSSFTTGTVYMGLKAAGTAAAADTMSSHAGWSELNITANRGTLSFSSASAGSKASSAAVSFAITAAGPTTVAGVFVVVGGTNAISNTTGTLFSAGDFATSRSVVSGDTLNVSYTVSV